MNYKVSKNCLLCEKPIEKVLSLGKTPLANELFKMKKKPELFPLNLMKCTECNHLQIDTLVDEKRLYNNYLYTANTSSGNRNYFKRYAQEMYERFKPMFVLDIGSNDGLFLSNFKKLGCEVVGIDPAKNIVDQANKNGIRTISGFFGENIAGKLQYNFGQFDLITCNNAFAHNADLKTIVKGVKALLAPTGVFVFEVSYAMNLLKGNLFDLIYHEHIHHWNLRPAIKFFNQFGLEIFDAQKTEAHGGSIRVFVQKQDIHKPSKNLRILQEEENQLEYFLNKFKKNIFKVKQELNKTISNIKKSGQSVAILGYPAKACTLSYFFGLDKVKNVFDDNPMKIGRYSHQGVKILSTEKIDDKRPDYLLILSWNYADELMKRFGTMGQKFIVPLPNVQVTE